MSLRDRDYMKWRTDAEAPEGDSLSHAPAPETFNLFAGLPIEDLKTSQSPVSNLAKPEAAGDNSKELEDNSSKGRNIFFAGLALALAVVILIFAL